MSDDEFAEKVGEKIAITIFSLVLLTIILGLAHELYDFLAPGLYVAPVSCAQFIWCYPGDYSESFSKGLEKATAAHDAGWIPIFAFGIAIYLILMFYFLRPLLAPRNGAGCCPN